MIHQFQKIGDVRVIFCPKKRDKAGKLFGFIRFSMKHAEEELLNKLNNIWIGFYKLRAFIPRFERENVVTRKEKKILNNITSSGVRRDGLSIAAVIIGEITTSMKVEECSTNFQYTSLPEDKEWLMACHAGFLKRKFSWEEHVEELASECGNALCLRSIGENLILINKGTYKSIKETIEEFDEWVDFWFEWTRPWKKLDINTNRNIWIKWMGILIHAWSNRFFAQTCAKIGLFIKMEEVKGSRTDLDGTRVMISTSCLNRIEETKKVRIDGSIFSIRVTEDSQFICI